MKNGNPRLLPTSQKIKTIFDFFLIIYLREKFEAQVVQNDDYDIDDDDDDREDDEFLDSSVLTGLVGLTRLFTHRRGPKARTRSCGPRGFGRQVRTSIGEKDRTKEYGRTDQLGSSDTLKSLGSQSRNIRSPTGA